MTTDPFDDLLGLEDDFYREGYDAGLVDGEHAGLVEGKVFGVEKGFEKALELGKLRGRAMVWEIRSGKATEHSSDAARGQATIFMSDRPLVELSRDVPWPRNSRTQKHIESLLAVTDEEALRTDNSDEAVTEFDGKFARAQAKAKVIAAILGESIKQESTMSISAGIEESKGLNARH